MNDLQALPQPMRNRSLATFLRSVLLAGVLPTLVGGLLLWWLSNTAMTQTQITSEQRQARAIALEINSYMDDLQRKLSYLSRVPGFADMSEDVQEALLVGLKNHHRAYAAVGIVGGGGVERVHLGVYDEDANRVQDNFAQMPFYRETAIRGQIHTGQVYRDPGVGLFPGEELLGETPATARPFPALTMAVPIRNSEDELDGSLVAVVDLTFLGHVLADNLTGNTSTIYILDRDNRVVARTGTEPGQLLDNEAAAPEWAIALASGPSTEGERSYNGDDVIGAAFPIRSTAWTLVVEQPKALALAAPRRMLGVLGGIAFLSVLGALLIATYTQRRVVDPLLRLTESVGAFARGEAHQPVVMRTGDELQLLGDTFNRMAGRLQDLLNTLEARVARRTSQLQTAAEVSHASSSLRGLDELLHETVELIRDRFDFYHSQVFLVEPTTNKAVLRASTGIVGRQLLARGHTLDMGGQSIIGRVTTSGQAVVARDVANDPFHQRNELLPNTRAELAVPIKLGGRIIGALDVQSVVVDAFNDDDIAVLQSLADQLAVAINNAQQFEAETQRRAQADKLREIANILNGARDTNTLTDVIVSQAPNLIYFDTVRLFLTSEDGNRLYLVKMRGINGESYAGNREEVVDPSAPSWKVVRERRPVILGDAAALSPAGPGGEPVGSWLGVPLLYGDEAIGVLSFEIAEHNHYTEQDANIGLTFAQQAAVALVKVRLFQQTQEALQESQALFALSRELASTLDRATLLPTALKTASHIPVTRASIGFFDDPEQPSNVIIEAVWDPVTGTTSPPRDPIPLERESMWPVRQMLTTHNPVAVHNDQEDMDPGLRRINERLGVYATLFVPIRVGEQIIGTFFAHRRDRHPFSEREMRFFVVVANQTGRVLENITLLEQTQANLAEMGTLYRLSTELSGTLDRQDIFDRTLGAVMSVRVDRAAVALFDNSYAPTQIVTTAVHDTARGKEKRNPLGTQAIPLERVPMVRQLHETGQPVIVQSVESIRESDPATYEVGVAFGYQTFAIFPVRSQSLVIGALLLYRREEKPFSSAELRLFEAAAAQASTALTNTELFDRVEQALDEASRLFRVSRRMATADALEEVNEAVIQSLRHPPVERVIIALLNAPDAPVEARSVTFSLVWDATHVLQEGTVLSAAEFPFLASPQAEDIVQVQDIRGAGVDLDEASVDFLQGWDVKTFISAPMRSAGVLLGFVFLHTVSTTHQFTPAEIGLARATAEQAASVIERLRLLELSQHNARHQMASAMIGRLLTEALSLEGLVDQFRSQEMHASLGDIVPFDRATLVLYRAEQDMVELIALNGGYQTALPEGSLMPLKTSVMAPVVRERQPRMFEVAALDSAISEKEPLQTAGIQHGLSMPLVVGHSVFGCLNLGRATDQPFTEEDVNKLAPVTLQIAIGFQNALLFAQTQQRLADLQQLRENFLDLGAQTGLNELLNLLAARGARMVGVGASALYLYDPVNHDLEQVVAYGLSEMLLGHRLPVGRGVAGTVAARREPVLIGDYHTWENRSGAYDQEEMYAVLGVPLLLRDQLIGVLDVIQTKQGHSFSDGDIQRLSLFADQAALAIENARLLAESSGRIQQLEALRQSFLAMGAQSDLTSLLDLITARSLEVVHADGAVLFMIAPGSGDLYVANQVRLPKVFANLRFPAGEDLAGRVAQSRLPLLIDDYQQWPGRYTEITPTLPFRSLLEVPLVWQNELLAVLGLFYLTAEKSFDVEAQQNLQLFADQAAVAISNVRLLSETNRRADELAAAAEVSRATAALLPPVELMNRAVNLIRERFHFYHAQVFLLDEQREWAVLVASTGTAGEQLLGRAHKLAVGSQSVIGYVTSRGEHLLAVAGGPIHKKNPLLPDTEAELALPMSIGQRVIGALDVQSTRADAFSEKDIEVLQTLANQLAVAIENADLFNRTEKVLRETKTLYDISSRLVLTTSPLQTARVIIEAVEQLGVEYVSVMLSIPGAEATFEVLAVDGPLVRNPDGKLRVDAAPPGTRYTAATNPFITLLPSDKPLIVSDVESDERMDNASRALAARLGVRSLSLVPVHIGSRRLGVIILGHVVPRDYSADELRLVETVADQSAVVLQNQQLFEVTQRNLDETSALYRVGSAILAATTLEEINDAVATYILPEEAVSSILWGLDLLPNNKMESSTILAYYHRNLDDVSPFVGRRFAAEEVPVFNQVDLGHPHVVESVLALPDLDERAKEFYKSADLGAFVVLPLRVRGNLYGSLLFGWSEPTPITIADVDRWRAVADQVAVAMQNLELLAETQAALEEAERLYVASRDLASAPDSESLVQAIARYFHPGTVTIALLLNYGPPNEDGRPAWCEPVVAWRADGRPHIFAQTRYDANAPETMALLGLAGNNHAFVISDLTEVEELPANVVQAYVEALGMRSVISAPLAFGEQQHGAVLLMSDMVNAFHDDDLRVMQTLSQQAGVVYQNQLLFEATQRSLTETRVLYEASNQLATAVGVEDIHNALLSLSQPLAPMSCGLFLFQDAVPEGGTPGVFKVVTESRFDGRPSEIGTQWEWEALPLTRLVSSDEPLVMRALADEQRFDKSEQAMVRDVLQVESAVVIPLRTNQRWLGAFFIMWSQPQALTDVQLRPFFTIADQAATVLDNRTLFEEAQAQARQIQALFEASQFISSLDRGLEAGLEALFGTLVQQSPFRHWWVALTTGEDEKVRLLTAAVDGTGVVSRIVPRYEIDNTALDTVFQTRKAVVVDDVTVDAQAAQLAPTLLAGTLPDQVELGMLLVEPMVLADRTLGAVILATSREGTAHSAEEAGTLSMAVTSRDIQLAQTLTTQLAVAVQNVHLFEETQRILSETQSLYEANSALNRANTFDEILAAVRPVVEPLDLEMLSLILFDKAVGPDETPSTMRYVSSILPPDVGSLTGLVYDLRSLPFSRYLTPNAPVIFADTSTDRRLTPFERDQMGSWHTRTLALVPLHVGNRWLGWISLSSSQPQRLDEARLRLVSTIAAQAAAVIESRQLFEAAQRRARRELMINQITNRLRQSMDPNAVLKIGAEELSRALNGARTSVWLDAQSVASRDSSQTDDTNGHP